VDNEIPFRRAVEEQGRLAVFSDFVGGTFGHLTDLGLDVLMTDLLPAVEDVMRERAAARDSGATPTGTS